MDHAVAGGRALTRHGTAHTAFPCPRQKSRGKPNRGFLPLHRPCPLSPARFGRLWAVCAHSGVFSPPCGPLPTFKRIRSALYEPVISAPIGLNRVENTQNKFGSDSPA